MQLRSQRERKLATEIRFSPWATRQFHATVARHPPETIAVLACDLAMPNRVVDLRFVPPAKRIDGSDDAAGSHVAPDMAWVNWNIVNEWVPSGLTIAGFIHSHPAGCIRLSGGEPGSNYGDIPSILNDLAIAPGAGLVWPYALMPIVTFDDDGQPSVTGWIVEPGNPDPHRVEVVFEGAEAPSNAIPDLSSIDDLVALGETYQHQINRVLGVDAAPQEDCAFMAQAIRRVMRVSIDQSADRLIAAI